MKQRLLYLDNLKGFLIILVILGHCIEYGTESFDENTLFKIIYSFHMPLFFMISGYLSYKEPLNWISSVKRRGYQLLVPYVLWGVGICLWHKYPLLDMIVDPGKILWFIWCLFYICLITYTIEVFFRNSRYFLLVLILTMMLLMGASFMIKDNLFGYKNIAYEFQYFIAGYLLKRYHLDDTVLNKKYIKLAAPVFVILLLFWHRNDIEIIGYQFNRVLSFAYIMLTAYMGCYVITMLFKEFGERKSFLTSFGTSSLGIYLVQLDIVRFGVRQCDNLFVVFILSTIVSLLFVKLVRASNYLRPIIGERIKINKSKAIEKNEENYK